MHAIAAESISWRATNTDSGRGRVGAYIGTPAALHEGPQAFLVQMLDEGGTIKPHFHDIDQFQVVVHGSGTIGKAAAGPFLAQYADAFTPYGPIIAAADGMWFFTLRRACSSGFYAMPGSRHLMPGRAGRNLAAAFLPPAAGEAPIVTQSLVAPADDGLRMDGLQLAADTATTMPADAGGGQYILVCTGTVEYDGQRLGPLSLLHVDAADAPPVLRAGPEGAALLLLQFPRPSERPGSDPAKLVGRSGTYTLPAGMTLD